MSHPVPQLVYLSIVWLGLWFGLTRLTHFAHIVPLAALDLYDRYRAIIFDLFDDPYYHRPGAPAPRARGLEEEDMMRTADDVVGTVMRAALGAWGGYILGRHWNLW